MMFLLVVVLLPRMSRAQVAAIAATIAVVVEFPWRPAFTPPAETVRSGRALPRSRA
ncbi:hypothetical protein [Bradyrhizobium sp. Bra78]